MNTTLATEPELKAATIPFVEYDLDNGLHVILSQVQDVPIVAVNLWYHVGSKDEEPTRTGFAHLFEHMMFQGSQHIGKAEHFKHLQNVGGVLNATTSVDRTNYFQTISSSDLELALWLESDRMMALQVTQENFENQRAVVKEERRQRYENQPYGTVWENIVDRLFPTSGYHWSTIGSMEHLDLATIEDVRNFHTQYYQPNNCSLCLSGHFDEKEARELIQKYFGEIKGTKTIDRPKQHVEPLTHSVRHTMVESVSLPAIYIAFQGATAYSDDGYALDILSGIMSTGRSSRLYQDLVYKKKISKDIQLFHNDNEYAGILALSSKVLQGHSIEEVEDAVWKQFEIVRDELVTERELTKAKNSIEMMLIRAIEELARRADQLQRAYTYKKNSQLANEVVRRYLSVTAEQVREVARKYIQRDRSVVIYVEPKSNS